jgi:hypothetical protein
MASLFLQSWAFTFLSKICRLPLQWTRISPRPAAAASLSLPLSLPLSVSNLFFVLNLKPWHPRYRNGQLLLEIAESLEQRSLKGAVYVGPKL